MLYEPWIRPELLRRLKMPVLVIAGSDDMIRERHTRRIARSLPNARLRILEGTHFIAAEKPDAFNQCVEAFLEGTQGGELAQMSRIWGSPESWAAGERENPPGGGAGAADSERRGVPRGV